MTDANGSTVEAVASVESEAGTDVESAPPVGEIVSDTFEDATPAARVAMIRERVAQMRTAGHPDSTMTVDERDALLTNAELSRSGVLEGNTSVPALDMLAALQYKRQYLQSQEESLSYQRALAWLDARARLIGPERPYKSGKEFVTQGLGYDSDSMVTTLTQLSDAIRLGVEDKSPQWRHLVQNARTRQTLRALVRDAEKTAKDSESDVVLPVEAARAVLDTRVSENPSGRPAKDRELDKARKAAAVEARKSESGESSESSDAESTDAPDSDRRGPGAAPTADVARGKCEEAVTVLREFFPHMTSVAQDGVAQALTDLIGAARTEAARIASELAGESNGTDAAPAPVTAPARSRSDRGGRGR